MTGIDSRHERKQRATDASSSTARSTARRGRRSSRCGTQPLPPPAAQETICNHVMHSRIVSTNPKLKELDSWMQCKRGFCLGVCGGGGGADPKHPTRFRLLSLFGSAPFPICFTMTGKPRHELSLNWAEISVPESGIAQRRADASPGTLGSGS